MLHLSVMGLFSAADASRRRSPAHSCPPTHTCSDDKCTMITPCMGGPPPSSNSVFYSLLLNMLLYLNDLTCADGLSGRGKVVGPSPVGNHMIDPISVPLLASPLSVDAPWRYFSLKTRSLILFDRMVSSVPRHLFSGGTAAGI